MYNNEYNKAIGERLKRNDKRHIARQEKAAHMGEPAFTSHLEGETWKNPEVQGGNGYAAGTLRDQGYEITNGVTGSGEPIIKKTRTRKPKIKGSGQLGLANFETEPRGDGPMPEPLKRSAPKSSKSKLADVTLKNKETTKPQAEETTRPQAEETNESQNDDTVVSGGAKKKRVNKYALLIKGIMQKHNIKNLAEASKYIKDNGLYKK